MKFYGGIAASGGAAIIGIATAMATYGAKATREHELGVLEERVNSKQQIAVLARAVDVSASAVAAVTAEPPTPAAPAKRAK